MNVYSYPGFRLELGDPVVVAQGDTYEKLMWGPYQFPHLTKTRQGDVYLTFNGPDAQDDIAGYEGEAAPFGAVSGDGGVTWRPLTAADEPVGIPMADGREYLPPKAKNGFEADWLDKYEPDTPGCCIDSDRLPDMYEADRISEYPRSPEAYNYDPATGVTTAFSMTVNWPHHAMLVYPHDDGKKLVYPMEMIMGGMGMVLPNKDGSMFFCTYQNGFSAETGEPMRWYLVTVLRSDDGGRTWNYLSEIPTPTELTREVSEFEGFCEPYMARMTDDSIIMLMRTGGGCPSYLVRSVDECRTWSKPVEFDSCGVFPQLLHLPCGVTLAGYGRPGVFLRVTDDMRGLRWEAPVDLNVVNCLGSDSPASCCYTSLLALDDTTALIAYSHFMYPNADGTPVKTILTRRIRILPA